MTQDAPKDGAYQHSAFHIPERMIPTATIPFVHGQPPGAQEGTPGMVQGAMVWW